VRAIVVVLGLVAGFVAPPPTGAQVFLASRPHAGLAVTPLFIVAEVSSDASDVPVQVMFSLMIPPDRSALELEQDLYLLWPGEVVGADTAGDIALPADVAAQVQVIARGRLRLQAQRHYESPADTEVMPTGAPFVSVVRTGGPLGVSPAATYIRIPWSPRLVNQAWLMSLHLTARGFAKPKPTTWLGRTVSGSRSTLALGFNDVGAPAMFAMYYWQRDNVLPVTSPARLVANFARADHLAVDQMFPPAARREPSPSRPGTDVVSLFLASDEGLTPQVLRVEFGYFSRLQSWGPVLIPALFFALGNVVGGLMRGFAQQMYRRLSGWLQLGRQRASAAGRDTGTVIPRDRLAAIVPGETTYEQVLRLCGMEVEEREDLAMPGRKTLVYRGRRDVPHRRWAWSWLAAVSYWNVERHEVEIAVVDGVVQNLQVRIGRARSARRSLGSFERTA
jgi:hypothetical protein